MTIPNHIQEFVRKRAGFRCEYCHYPESLSTSPLTIDHIYPQSLNGSDDADNLALACRRCNERHYNFTVGIDPETNQEVTYLILVSKIGLNTLFGQQMLQKLLVSQPRIGQLVID